MDKIKFLKPLEVESLVVTKAIEGTGGTDAAISAHNSNTSAHADIREEISQLSSEKVDKHELETIKAEITVAVIESLGGNPVFGYVDENNNIIVQGNLADGTYSVKYEMEDGSKVNIGNLVLDSNVYYSVTKNLTKCSISNGATRVVEGESYSATITANSGYELKSVTVTMGGSPVSVSGGNISIASVTGDIVITAVAEEIPAATYTITNNLTNCKNSNSATTVEEGSAYSATITANSGYTLDSVSATMGGAAVTVTDGKINIASVTGNIVITATAKAIPTYTNLADPTSADWWADGYLSSSGGMRTREGYVVSNFIGPVNNGDIIRIKGIDTTGTIAEYRCAIYTSDKVLTGSYGVGTLSAFANINSPPLSDLTQTTTNAQFTVASGDGTYWRIGGKQNGTANDVIITINEPIE